MSMLGAFARTSVLRAGEVRAVSADKIKWWAKKKACDGEITRHISAHEQHPVGPWLKTFPKKVVDRAPTYIIWPGGCLLLTYAIVLYTSETAKAEEMSHRY